MGKNLVIVESPAKAKTLKKYLGDEFEVLASYGHVRDLIPKEGAVDPAHDFAMKYQLIERNQRHFDSIAKAAHKADALFLATDPDREGEAISWHLYELLKERDVLDSKPVQRVVFHEITKRAVQDAIDHPRSLSMDLVNAQQARRALDYLVGFNLSPLLWRKIRRGLSAGRVQSPALRMIVEREEQIERFESQEYWSLEADATKGNQIFKGRLIEYQGEKMEQFSVTDGDTAHQIQATLKEFSGGKLLVSKVDKKKRKRNPAPPFITSTLQQEASRKLGFTTQRTMRVAQQLYEGIDIGDGAIGLISYMRTDSVNLAQEAITDIRQLIQDRFGAHNVPEQIRVYKTKAKNAQEAHEAIRPTSAAILPEEIKSKLNDEQYRLYDLIWKRAVACQMIAATLDTVAVDLSAGSGNTFRANGSSIADPGFMMVYQEGVDDARKDDDDGPMLPTLLEGEEVVLLEVRAEQHFTEPPPRYSEASLVKVLEEFGIGRPSTYSSIISTLLAREYVTIDKRRFTPTDTGRIVNRFLTQHFGQYVDYDFTARMEDNLDAVSRGEKEWIPLMGTFWDPFKELVDEKAETVSRTEARQARELGTDPKSDQPVSVRMARYGPVAQIGSTEDEEKPKFAGLRPDQRMDTITLEEALELFKLPRELGQTDAEEPVSANIGRFGPYVRYGNKFVSLKEDDPYSVTLERALELVAEHKQAEANKIIQSFDGSDIQILRGRYGPYITDGKKNAKVPKGREPESLTLEECSELIAAAPEKKARRGGGGRRKASA